MSVPKQASEDGAKEEDDFIDDADLDQAHFFSELNKIKQNDHFQNH